MRSGGRRQGSQGLGGHARVAQLPARPEGSTKGARILCDTLGALGAFDDHFVERVRQTGLERRVRDRARRQAEGVLEPAADERRERDEVNSEKGALLSDEDSLEMVDEEARRSDDERRAHDGVVGISLAKLGTERAFERRQVDCGNRSRSDDFTSLFCHHRRCARSVKSAACRISAYQKKVEVGDGER